MLQLLDTEIQKLTKKRMNWYTISYNSPNIC